MPLEFSQSRLAEAIDVPSRRVKEIVHGKRRITADTALRPSRYFGTTDRFWLASRPASICRLRSTSSAAALDWIEPCEPPVHLRGRSSGATRRASH